MTGIDADDGISVFDGTREGAGDVGPWVTSDRMGGLTELDVDVDVVFLS